MEEFFAAALPSVFLNLKAFVLLNTLTLIISRRWFVIDLAAIAPLFLEKPDASKLIASGALRGAILYLVVLGLVSWWTGSRYGKLLVKIAGAGPDSYFSRFTGIRVLPALVAAMRYKFWQTFYAQYQNWLVPTVIRQDRVFVGTKDRLYYGRMHEILKAPDGEISGIVLAKATEPALEEDKPITRGESSIIELQRPFLLRWSEITDIDFPRSMRSPASATDGSIVSADV